VEHINSGKINKFMDDIKNTLSKLDALSEKKDTAVLNEGAFGKALGTAAGFLPVVGSAMSFKDAYDSYKAGDKTGAALNAVIGAAGLVPGGSIPAKIARGIGTGAVVGSEAAAIKRGEYDELPDIAKDWYDYGAETVKNLSRTKNDVKETKMNNVEQMTNLKNKINEFSTSKEEKIDEKRGGGFFDFLRRPPRPPRRPSSRTGGDSAPASKPTPSPTSTSTSSGTVNTARPNNPNAPYREVPGASPVTTDLTGAPVNPGGISATGSTGARRAQAAADARLDAQRTASRDALTALKPSPGGSAGVGSATGRRPTGGGSVTPDRTAAGVATAAAVGTGALTYGLSNRDGKKPEEKSDSTDETIPDYSDLATIMQGTPPAADALIGGRPAVSAAPAAAAQPAAAQPAATSSTQTVTEPATTASAAPVATAPAAVEPPRGPGIRPTSTFQIPNLPQGSALSPDFATRTGPFQFTDAQKQWLGGANPQDPHIIARMRRAVGGPLPPVDYFKNPEDQAIARQLNVGRDNLNRVRGAVGSKPLGTDGNFPDQDQQPPAKKPRWQPTEPLPTNLESVYPNKRPLNFRENRHSAVNRLTRKFENYIENKFNIVENNYVSKKKNLR
jgi:hypothetical protein